MVAKNGKKKSKFLIIIIALLIVIIGVVIFYVTGIGSVSSDSKSVTVEIAYGSGSSDIINALDDAGLIKSNICAKVYMKLNAPDSLQANTYILNENMSLSKMVDIINTGDLKYVLSTKFTIIEGATIPEAAEKIAKETDFTKAEILEKWANKDYLKQLIEQYWFLTDDILNSDIMYPLEGYLYPETYFITEKKPNIESLTKNILDTTKKKLDPYKSQIEKSGMGINQFMAFASLVQAEALYEKDRPKIAGVFMNRLDIDMPLQSDVTVLYALQEKRINVTNIDTSIDSKYNTYKYQGVPIGPICTIQDVTIKDCLNYEENDYLYFFAKKDGTVIYSKTLNEHEKAVKENLWY